MNAVLQSAKSAAGWKLIPLKELGKWSGGGTPSKSKPEFWINGTIPWVSPKDMKTARITESQDQITEAAIEESAAKLIPAQSILIVTRSGILSHTLPVAVTTLPVSVNQDLKALTPNETVLPDYVAWALRCFAREILNTCSKQGTTVSSIETRALQAFEIPVAPLDKQQEIVAEIEKQLSRLDEAVTNLHRVKANLKRYKAAVLRAAVEGRLVETEAELARREGRSYETGEQLLQRILEARRSRWLGEIKYNEPVAPRKPATIVLPEGWVWATVSQLIINPIANGLSVKESEEVTEVKALRLSAMTESGFDYEDVRHLPRKLEDVSNLVVNAGEVFVSRGNGTLDLLGRATVAQQPPTPVIFPDTMMRLRFCEEILATSWLTTIWTSRLVRKQIESLAKTTAGIYKISQKDLARVEVPLPPSGEQRRLVSKIMKLNSQTQNLLRSNESFHERATALRTSILSGVFMPNIMSRIELV